MSIPYNENRNDNLFVNKKLGVANNESVSDINNLNSSLLNNNFQDNKININLNSLSNNNRIINNNDMNLNINGKILPIYSSAFTSDLLNNQNNNIYNKANILYQTNTLNNQQINANFMGKNLIKPIMQDKNINFNKNIGEIKTADENEINNELNKKSQNSKIYFVTQEQKNNNTIPNNIDKKFNNDMKKDYTPLDLLHLIGQKPSNEQTNNNITNFKRNNSNNSLMNNILKTNNENLNFLQNNILGLNASQQLNDYSQLKYNGSLGLNDINLASQLSFFSSKNQYNFNYNNIFSGQEDENLKQLIGRSSENFFKSYYIEI